MRRVLALTAAAAFFGSLSLTSALACDKEAATAATPASVEASGQANEKSDKRTPTYKFVVGSLETAVGKHGVFNLKIVPAKGYKVNKEYPTKFIFKSTPTTIDLDKKVYKKGDTKVGDKGTLTVAMGGKGKAAGTETIKAEAKFSICNATTCLLEKATVSVSVAVK